MDFTMNNRWAAVAEPAWECNQAVFQDFFQRRGHRRNVLNCAIPSARAKVLTDFTMPEGWDADKSLIASVGFGAKLPPGLENWSYAPKIQAVKQLPQMKELPTEHSTLMRSPWFQSPSQALGLGINARHLRYHYQLWNDLQPKTLRGVFTTLVYVTPQLGYSLTPHIKLDRVFRYFGALSRFAGPAQLFPASYLYPDAKLQGMEKVPAAMFADILPNLGSSFPLMDETPNPWNILVRLNGPDCYYGYPFSRVSNPVEDTTVSKVITGSMTLPNGKLVQARNSESFRYATLDAKLKDALKLERYGFHDAYCLDRGVITHDGLPFILPTEMQTSVFAVILTSWELEMDKPGDLTSYTLKTQHSAIRGYNFYQKTMSLNSDFDRWMGFPDDVIGKYPQEVKSAMSILTAINHVYYAQQPNNFRAWRQSVCPPTDELAIPSKPSNTKPSNTKKLNKTVKQSKNMTTTSLAEPTKAKPAPATPTTATTTPPENTAPVDAASLGFGASSDDDADRSEAAATAKSAEQNRGGGTSLGAFVEGTVIHKSREGSHFFRPIAFPGRPNLVADVDDPSRLLLRWWMRYTLYRVADRASGQDSGGIICRPGEVLLKQARIALYQHPEIGPRYKAQTQTGFSINTSERIVFLTLPFDGNGLACAELLDLPISRDKNPKKPTDAPKRQCGDDLREMPRAREDDPITLANMGLADGAVPPLKHGAIYSLEKGRIVALHQQGTKETMVRVIEAKSVYPLADVGNKVKPAYIGLLQDAAARFGRQPMEKLLRYSSKEDQINWVQMIAPADFGAVALRAMGVKNAPAVTAPVEHGEPAVQE